MPNPTTLPVKLRTGFILSLDACLRYLGSKGHGFSFTNLEPCSSFSREKQERMCEEERKIREQDDLEAEQIKRVHDLFRHLRRKAPKQARVRLVLPHTFIRIVIHERFGERHQQCLFLPTGSGDSSSLQPSSPATTLDSNRLETFIEIANSLLQPDANHEAAKLMLSDFTFSPIPASAIFEPVFNDQELKELRDAGPEAIELYGISVRQFLTPYRVV